MGTINSYKDLEVWKKSMLIITDVYRVSQSFPSHELYGITSQMRRASCSVPLNIAEGWGRESTKNYIQFLRNSRGSLMELENCLLISVNLNYISPVEMEKINPKITEVSKMLNGLIGSLKKKIKSRIAVAP